MHCTVIIQLILTFGMSVVRGTADYTSKDDVLFISATREFQLFLDGREALSVTEDPGRARMVQVPDWLSLMAVYVGPKVGASDRKANTDSESYFMVWSMNGYYITDKRWKCWETFPGLGWYARDFRSVARPSKTAIKNSILPSKSCHVSSIPPGNFIGTGGTKVFCRTEAFTFRGMDPSETFVMSSNVDYTAYFQAADRSIQITREMIRGKCSFVGVIPRDVERLVVILNVSGGGSQLGSHFGFISWSRTGIFNSDGRWRCSHKSFEPGTPNWPRGSGVFASLVLGTNRVPDNLVGVEAPFIHPRSRWIGPADDMNQSKRVVCKLDLLPTTHNNTKIIHKEGLIYRGKSFPMFVEGSSSELVHCAYPVICTFFCFTVLVTAKFFATSTHKKLRKGRRKSGFQR